MDVKNAFLNGNLSEEVYMQPPPGLSVESNKVCHLRRALYDLKQAPRVWFAKFSSTISRLSYMASHYDSALFIRRTDKGTILLLLYVDDMIITGDDLNGIQELKVFLNQQFEMKDLGHLSYFLGLEITHSTDELYITQAKYASELLSRAGLTDRKTVDTPVELNAYLTPTGGKPLSNPSLLQTIGWQLSLSHRHSSRHLLYCSSGEPVSVCFTIYSLCCCSTHSSIPKGHSLPWPFLLSSNSSCTLCIL